MSHWCTGGQNKAKLLILRICVVFFWTVGTKTAAINVGHQFYSTKSSFCRRDSGGGGNNNKKMFNLYSSMNRRGADGVEEKKEVLTTGHDRFFQQHHSR